jgi:cytochrome b pre-mRNA-processing protein 3
MFSWIRADDANRRTAHDIYGAAVAQARHPAFYAEAGIPDTLEGRYEVIVLHLFLVLERLRQAGPAGEPLARSLIETFVTDMDDQMREIGVGDLTVPKRVKKAAAGLYARSGQYRTALASATPAALADALAAILPAGKTAMAPALAQYVREAEKTLAAQREVDLAAGRLAFPPAGPFEAR